MRQSVCLVSLLLLKTDEVGERIPLTICDYDRENETVTIVVQTIGAGTERMMALKEGDSLEDFCWTTWTSIRIMYGRKSR